MSRLLLCLMEPHLPYDVHDRRTQYPCDLSTSLSIWTSKCMHLQQQWSAIGYKYILCILIINDTYDGVWGMVPKIRTELTCNAETVTISDVSVSEVKPSFVDLHGTCRSKRQVASKSSGGAHSKSSSFCVQGCRNLSQPTPTVNRTSSESLHHARKVNYIHNFNKANERKYSNL